MENRNLRELNEENIAYANDIVSNTSQLVVAKSINGERMTRDEREISRRYFEALNLLNKAKKKNMQSSAPSSSASRIA